MQRYSLKKQLPSCEVSQGLLQQIEAFLDRQINTSFGKTLARMKELYGHQDLSNLKSFSLQIQHKDGQADYSSSADIPSQMLSEKTKSVRMRMRFGQPELLTFELDFPAVGRPTLEVSTLRQDQKKSCQLFAKGALSILQNWTNRNSIIGSLPLLIFLTLLLPTSLVVIGWLRQADLFNLLCAQGWTLLLSGGLAYCLRRLFPPVHYRTPGRVQWRRLLWVVAMAVLLAAIAGYATLLFVYGR